MDWSGNEAHEEMYQQRQRELREIELLRAVEAAMRGLKVGKLDQCRGRTNKDDETCDCGWLGIRTALAALDRFRAGAK